MTASEIGVFCGVAIAIIPAILYVGGIFNRIKTLETMVTNLTSFQDRIIKMETKIDLLIKQK